MGWKIVGYLLAFILAVSILINIWNAIGMWLIWGPLILIGAVVLVPVTAALLGQGHAWRQRRLVAATEAARDLKQRTATSEAALGIPIPADETQPCPVCARPRVVGARYCADCSYDWEPEAPSPHALICSTCDQRMPDDSRVCPFCGTPVPESQRLWHLGETSVPRPRGPQTWRCSLCGTDFILRGKRARQTICKRCGATFDWDALPGNTQQVPNKAEPGQLVLSPV